MEIKRATRVGVKPLIGLYSESGCGKTYSSLLMARGFVGKNGRIVLIDTESGRGSLYADVIEGGYDVLEIRGSFAPSVYVEAIRDVEKSGVSIGIIDSISHEWEGIGGVLDQAAINEEKSGKKGLHCWNKPKMEHAKMMLCLLQSSIPWIVCMRSKHKSRQTKDEHGKTVIVKDDFTTPIQSEDFTFEMTCHGEIMPDHSFRLTKSSHPELRKCFRNGVPIDVETGISVAEWCREPEAIKGPSVDIQAAKTRLWHLTERIHCVPKGCKNENTKLAGKKILEQWLWDEGLMNSDGETLELLSPERLSSVVKSVEEKLK